MAMTLGSRMSSKQTQIKNSAIYLLPVLVGNLLPLLALPIFTRFLSKEDYGVWALAQVYAVFVNGVANFGLTVGYERNFFEHKEKEKIAALLYSTLTFVLFTFFGFGLLTWVFRDCFAGWVTGSREHGSLLFWSYCATSLLGLKTYYLTYFKNTENARAYAIYTIDENLLGVFLSLLMVCYFRIGVIGLVWGQLLASCVIFLVLSVRFVRELPIVFSWSVLKESLKLSWPLTPRIFFGIIGSQFDKYMIGLLGTVGGVGVYNIGQKVANVVFTFMTAIQNVFSPQVYKRMFEMGEEGKESIGRYLTPFLYVSILVGLLVSLFSEEMIYVLTPKSYHEATDIITILSMLFGTYFFGKQPQLIYAKKTHVTSILTLVAIGLNVAINIPFISRWGATGAAWGTLAAGVISGGITFAVSQRYYAIRWEYRKIGLIMALFFCAGVSMVILRWWGLPYTPRVVAKLLFLALYLFLGLRIGVLTPQNYQIVTSMFRKTSPA